MCLSLYFMWNIVEYLLMEASLGGFCNLRAGAHVPSVKQQTALNFPHGRLLHAASHSFAMDGTLSPCNCRHLSLYFSLPFNVHPVFLLFSFAICTEKLRCSMPACKTFYVQKAATWATNSMWLACSAYTLCSKPSLSRDGELWTCQTVFWCFAFCGKVHVKDY